MDTKDVSHRWDLRIFKLKQGEQTLLFADEGAQPFLYADDWLYSLLSFMTELEDATFTVVQVCTTTIAKQGGNRDQL